jgi:hypothetical protein
MFNEEVDMVHVRRLVYGVTYLGGDSRNFANLQICFNNVGCHGFEFATPYRALPSFVNDPLKR